MESRVYFERLIDEADKQNLWGDSRSAFFASRLNADELLAFRKLSLQLPHEWAHPSRMIPRIRATQFRLPTSTEQLAKYIARLGTVHCSVPLGRFQGMAINFAPRSFMMELSDQREKWQNLGKFEAYGKLASTEYFCITLCTLKDGSGRFNPGVRDIFFQLAIQGECLCTSKIPLDDERAGIISGPVRKISDGSDSSKTSGGSNESIDSESEWGRDGDLKRTHSWPASVALAASPRSKKERWSEAPGISGMLTTLATNQDITLKLCISQPFYYLGELVTTIRPDYEERRPNNYIVAVSLYDLSVWLIYNAWDYWYAVDEDDLEDGIRWDNDAYLDQSPVIDLERQKCFRPDRDSLWARFPGLPGRTLMVKIADNVHSWHFNDPAGPELRMDPIWTCHDGDVVPAFICARLTSDGYVIRPRVDREYGALSQE
ncbi:MAG: hypothetical protein M1816_000337 [Peltula sp. TS41687]|nr:MAG: hypothetical protein M1816_000337 [Peltula sp. TS41687]